MIKRLWILWLQGFEGAPRVVKECLRSWKTHNSDSWETVELCQDNIERYVHLEDLIPRLSDKQITKAALSDIIRIEILRTFGGLWVDATTFCTKPLDGWLNDYVREGFFAFESKGDRLLSSWFLYADKPNYIVDKWHEAAFGFVSSHETIGARKDHISISEWTQGIEHDHYFWFHYLFGDLCTRDEEFGRRWERVGEPLTDLPVDAARWWSRANLEVARWAHRQLGERYFLLRYEDLCDRPVETLSALSSFTGSSLSPMAIEHIAPAPTLGRWTAADETVVAGILAFGKPGLEKFGYVPPDSQGSAVRERCP